MIVGFVKSPDAQVALRPSSLQRTEKYASLIGFSSADSSNSARLACGLFTKPTKIQGFCNLLRVRHD
jgi:hypothetical protein